HLARKQGLRIAVSGAEAEAFVNLPRANLTSLATEVGAEHLGLFDHAQKSYWVALQARLPRQNIIEEPHSKAAEPMGKRSHQRRILKTMRTVPLSSLASRGWKRN